MPTLRTSALRLPAIAMVALVLLALSFGGHRHDAHQGVRSADCAVCVAAQNAPTQPVAAPRVEPAFEARSVVPRAGVALSRGVPRRPTGRAPPASLSYEA